MVGNGQHLVGHIDPNIDGWVWIGTIHTHGGFGNVGPDEKDMNPPFEYLGMLNIVMNYNHFKIFVATKNGLIRGRLRPRVINPVIPPPKGDFPNPPGPSGPITA